MQLEQTWECACCGEKMSGLQTSFACHHPDNWTNPDKDEKRSKLSSDLCEISYSDDIKEFYIRCTMEFPIVGQSQTLMFGLWASVSRETFSLYERCYKTNDLGIEGAFCYTGNKFPCVADTFGLHADMYFSDDDQRPTMFLHDAKNILVDMQEGGIPNELLVEINKLFTKH